MFAKPLVSFAASMTIMLLSYPIDPVSSLFFGFLGLVYLFEFLAFNVPDGNLAMTRAAFVCVTLQPLVLALLVYLYGSQPIWTATLVLLGAYALLATLWGIAHWSRIRDTPSNAETRGCVKWAWYGEPWNVMVTISAMILIVLILSQHYAWPKNAIMIGSVVFAALLTRLKAIPLGRVWCDYAALVQVLSVIAISVWQLYKQQNA